MQSQRRQQCTLPFTLAEKKIFELMKQTLQTHYPTPGAGKTK
jgi:hypothetical protein